MTGFKSKRQAALDEEGMYLVHHTEPAQESTLQEKDRKRGSIALARSLCYQIAGAASEDDDISGSDYGSVDVAEILSAEVVRLQKALAQPEQEPVAYYHPRNGFYWAKPTSIFAPTSVDVEPMPLYAAAERNNG